MWQYKGYDLPRDFILLLWIGSLLIYYDCLIRFRPLPEILGKIRLSKSAHLGLNPNPPTTAQLKTMDKIYRGASFCLTQMGRSARPCLRRSLVLYRWCTAQGLCTRVVVGVRKDGSDLQGHSWLLLDERPYHEESASLAQYSVFLEG